MADPTGADSNGGTTTVVSNPPNPPTTNTVPNTTTDTTTVQYQSAATDSTVNPASDPSQFPAYDDEGNLQPGFAINPETGGTYYAGVGPAVEKSKVSITSDPNYADYDMPAGPSYADSDIPLPVNSPYYGLTPEQISNLGQADPTDPYIRARLGIPQLPGSTLNATSGFGFGNLTTNFPSIDNALGTIRSLFSGTIGSLFSNTTASNTAATTGSGVAALVAPATPGTTDTAVNPASDPSQFPAYDDEGNLQLGFKINEETGQPYYAGVGPATTNSTTTLTSAETAAAFDGIPAGDTTTVSALTAKGVDTTTLSADQADAYYNGTGTLTAEQRLAQDQQIAADAAKLYPGSNNEALRQIDIGAGRIAENEVGIANAEQIINRNNAELADPNISDARRAELLANNEAQLDYIQAATENIAIQQNVIEQNANVYAAGGGNEGDGQSPTEVSALEDPGLDPVVEEIGPLTEADVPVDPLTDEELAVQEAFQQDNREILANEATDVDPAEDPFEQARLDAIAAEEAGPTETDLAVDPLTDEELAVQEAFQQDQRDQLAAENFIEQPPDVDPNEGGLELPPGAEPDGPPQEEPFALNPDEDAGIGQGANNAVSADNEFIASTASQFQGSQQAAIVAQAKKQATIQARYKQPGNTDWRVRLSLGPGAKYLYNATPAGPLAPLAANGGTDGVIFPYTPSITTTYSANYEQYDLIHSNYRGLFYKNSRVGDIQIRGTFTAQNTTEANYLLAVIHFFRSVTKMFYGQDAERGTPPPICLLNGFGGYQFSDHPVVVSSFNYTLPNDVDYIRTTNPNNFGLNLNNRYNPAGASLPAGGALAGLYRLLNARPGGLPKGAQPVVPAPNTVAGSVTNNVPASYVPTKMEIDITLIPVQSRSQVSQQFSLKGFANGDLLKGGFW